MAQGHFEPYLHLAGLTDHSVLIAWGGFYFESGGQGPSAERKLVEDEQANLKKLKQYASMGEETRPLGKGRVEVFRNGELVASAETTEQNHLWVENLEPDTDYTYRVFLDGEEWAAGPRRDWIPHGSAERTGLHEKGGRYDNRFRTHPTPNQPARLTFAILGDYGVGMSSLSDSGRRQLRVAEALERAVRDHDVRLIITTGDNIYNESMEGTGDDDDDWFFTFYQPYRYILNRIPIYPGVGNHDSAETERADDRTQMEDNFYISERFRSEREAVSSLGPGLFYQFRYGCDIEFTAIDTTESLELPEKHFFDSRKHLAFLEKAFPKQGTESGPKWRIPFSHHPPYCAGPHHCNMPDFIQTIIPLLQRAGVRVVFSGHEHNFQYSRADGIHYFISGAGGKLRPDPPSRFEEAHTAAWAVDGHFLLVTIEEDRMVVRPVAGLGDDGALRELPVQAPDGSPVPTATVIRAAG